MRALLLLAIACPLLLADGAPFVPEQQVIYEYGQIAAISRENGQENLIVAGGFSTTSESLAWLIPLPAEPAVDSAGYEFFYRLSAFCAPSYRSNNGLSCGAAYNPELGNRSGGDSGVREIGSGIIGDFAWQTLEAYQSETLEDYLVQHGYGLPANVRDGFEHYLNQGWHYFFVARVVDSNNYSYWPGVRLRFASDSLVFPLYISRLNGSTSVVTLYVFGDHRQMYHGGMLRFSGEAGPDSFPELTDHKCRLTKLTKTFTPDQMQDLTLRDAPDDKDYREIQYSGGIWLMSFGLIFGAMILTARRRCRRKKGALLFAGIPHNALGAKPPEPDA